MPVTGLKANPQRSPHGRREDIELLDRKEVCEGPLTRTIAGELQAAKFQGSFLEAGSGIEPLYEDLQSSA